MFHDLTKAQKHALRDAAALAHQRDRKMAREDRDVHYLEAENADLPLVVGGAIFQGILAIDEIGEPAREIMAEVAAGLQAIRDTLPAVVESAADEDEGYDASAPVSVAAIVCEFGLLRQESTLYVNRRTGDVRVVGHEDLPDVNEDEDEDFDADLDDAPDWEVALKAEAREIATSADWVELLDHVDLDDYEIMKRFALRRAGPAASRDLLDALRGPGAYRRFRDEIHRRGMQKEWDAFHDEWLADLVRGALRERGVAFRK